MTLWIRRNVILLGVTAVLCSCRKVHRDPQYYIFPNAYRGWVSITYRVPTATHPASNEKKILFDFSNNPNIDTRLPPPEGWATDEFYEKNTDGSLVYLDIYSGPPPDNARAIRDHYLKTDASKAIEWIFLGTKADLEANPDANPSHHPFGEVKPRGA